MLASTESLVSTVAAAIAAVAALVALVLARRTLSEARATTKAQRETITATEAVAGRIESSTQALRLILSEGQAARELEQLRLIANQVGVVTVLRRRVTRREAQAGPSASQWIDFGDSKQLLAAYLAALPSNLLPACRLLADPSDARLSDPQTETDAQLELARAFTEVGARIRDSVQP